MQKRVENTKNRRVLIVSGVDPSGAAGFILDVAVASRTGVEVAGFPSILVAENYEKVTKLEPVNPSLLIEALNLALEEGGFQSTKIGLVSKETLKALLTFIQEKRKKLGYIVVDPVLFSSSGFSFHKESAKLFVELFKYVDLITPNLEEFKKLSGYSHPSAKDVLNFWKEVVRPASLLITSYEVREKILANLLVKEGTLSRFRVLKSGYESRGTGCALSTLIACYIACGFDEVSAIKRAMKKVKLMLENSSVIKKTARRLGVSKLRF